MCGRYFWTDDAEDEFEEDFPRLAGEIRKLRAGDYTPAMTAVAVTAGDHTHAMEAAGVPADNHAPGMEANAGNGGKSLSARSLQWGFPGFDKGKLLINALRTVLPSGGVCFRQQASMSGTGRKKR